MSATPSPPDHAKLARDEGGARARGETETLARLTELVGVVYRLRDPDGCPWDNEQTVESMAKNLLEESFETAEAIAAKSDAETCEELGDVLMNIVLIARIAEQGGRFSLAEVAAGIAEKLVRRHPHVFGDRVAADADEALANWNATKQAEGKAGRESVLDGVPENLPGLLRALRIGEKAARVGFDWPEATGALGKLDEETTELRAACDSGDPDRIEDELGDVLFAAVNVARFHKLDPEQALRRTIAKFRRRFAVIEDTFGEQLGTISLEELEAEWRRAADAEGSPAAPGGAPPTLP